MKTPEFENISFSKKLKSDRFRFKAAGYVEKKIKNENISFSAYKPHIRLYIQY